MAIRMHPCVRRGTPAIPVLCLLGGLLLHPGAVLAQTPVPGPGRAAAAAPAFDIRRETVPGGAELLTVFGRADAGLSHASQADQQDLPLVSVLRDTLGDADSDNDRLRYVWVHGYTRPSAPQRVASAVPFFNRRAGNKKPSRATAVPRPVIDLADPARRLWKDVMWYAAQSVFFDPYGVLAKTSVRAFRRNDDDYRKAHIVRALAVLSLYEAETGTEPVLSELEMRDIQARLVLAQKTLGGIVNDAYLQRAYERDVASTADIRGHNWELLRQRSEAEGLYFEPLEMPDGSATHAIVWVARDDVEDGRRRFDARFLNLRKPWGDVRLRGWTGYTETRFYDAGHQRVPPEAPGARRVELIPLALYGLDHPKIPIVLVDFRDRDNPKRREVSRRVLNDVTRNVLSLSPYGDIHYFLARSVYDFVTGRRGMDINQPSRLRSYSQLKLLLSLTSALEPDLAEQTSVLLERVSMNPLQNDTRVEMELAYRSYATLKAAIGDPAGAVARRLEADRRAEFRRLEHGRTARTMLTVATVLTAGIYRHREPAPAGEQLAAVDRSRRLNHHERFLEEVAASTPVIDIVWNMDDVRRSLQYLAEHATPRRGASERLAVAVFERTQDRQAQRLSVGWLARMGTPSARAALARIEQSPAVDPGIRALGARYLRGAVAPSAAAAASDVPTATND
jgi:hypothetical protein